MVALRLTIYELKDFLKDILYSRSVKIIRAAIFSPHQ
jgi:hypothetical protein